MQRMKLEILNIEWLVIKNDLLGLRTKKKRIKIVPVIGVIHTLAFNPRKIKDIPQIEFHKRRKGQFLHSKHPKAVLITKSS